MQHPSIVNPIAPEQVHALLQQLSLVKASLCHAATAAFAPKPNDTPHTMNREPAAPPDTGRAAAPDHAAAAQPSHAAHSPAAAPAPNAHLPPIHFDPTVSASDASDVVASHSTAYAALLQHSMQQPEQQQQPPAPAPPPPHLDAHAGEAVAPPPTRPTTAALSRISCGLKCKACA